VTAGAVRIAVIWAPEARADLRAINRETAMQVLYCIDRYLAGRVGEVKRLKTPLTGFRLRCGDHRVFFDQRGKTRSRSLAFAIGVKLTGETIAICTVLNPTSPGTRQHLLADGSRRFRYNQ